MQSTTIDLHGGRTAVPVWRRGVDRSVAIPSGVVVAHGGCRTFVAWTGPQAVVQLESLQPLSVDGDFVCGCGAVGTLLDGRWVAR